MAVTPLKLGVKIGPIPNGKNDSFSQFYVESKYWSTEIRKLGFENNIKLKLIKILKYRICDFIIAEIS